MLEEMKATDRRLHDAINTGRLDVVDEVCSPDVVIHDPTIPGGLVKGRDPFKLYITGYRTAFPDFHIEDLNVIGEGDYLAGRIRTTGTHKGDLLGNPPTGKKFDAETLFLIRFQDGLEAEFWMPGNPMAIVEQLGITPQIPTPVSA